MSDWSAQLVSSASAAWVGLNPEAQGAILTSSATFVAALIGFAAIVVQIGRQARAAIEQQKRNDISKLNLRIYEEIIEVCDRVTNAEVRFKTSIAMFVFQLENAVLQKERGVFLAPPATRFPAFQDQQTAVHMAAVGVISIVERWGIVDLRLGIFQTAINVALFDVAEGQRDLLHLAMRYFPREDPATGQTLPWNAPSREVLNEIAEKARILERALDLLGAFMEDFRVETQKAMLGGIFSEKPQVRRPIDPYFRTIELSRHEELNRFFETETSWGRAKIQAEEAARAALP